MGQNGERNILCRTCLHYFDLSDFVQVVIVGGLANILNAQWKVEKCTVEGGKRILETNTFPGEQF